MSAPNKYIKGYRKNSTNWEPDLNKKKSKSSSLSDDSSLRSSSSGNSDDYPTDKWLYEIFESWFDPCEISNGELRAFDGLGDWKDKTFVNPPYSDPLPWVRKAIAESKKGKRIVMLLKADTSTKWFSELQNNGAKFLWVNGRLKYKTGKPAPFPSVLVVLNNRGEQ